MVYGWRLQGLHGPNGSRGKLEGEGVVVDEHKLDWR